MWGRCFCNYGHSKTLKKHYALWKIRKGIENKVNICGSLSEMHEDEVLDKEIEKAETSLREIEKGKCIIKLNSDVWSMVNAG